MLGVENERKMVHHIKKLQAQGFAPTRADVQGMAFMLAEKLNIKHNFDREREKAGYDWLQSFLSRNPDLSVRKSEGVSVNRALGMNKKVVGNYFDLLEKTVVDNNLVGKPGNIFNLDETGLQLNNKAGDVIAARGSKCVSTITSGEKGETVSVIACFIGEGTYIPPFCVFKGKNKKQEFTNGMPPGSVVVMNEKSAYVNSTIFFEWLQNQFVPRKPAGKTLLILDGHASHCSNVEMLEFAVNNDIIMLCLPSHTTHYLQPLDRTFFKSLKSNYNLACSNFMKNNPSMRITRLQFGQLLGFAWSKSATVENALSGFNSTGIIPLNRFVIPEYAYMTGPNMERNYGPQEEGTDLQQMLNADVAIPGTSSEVTQKESNTPSKLLNAISPVPVVKKQTSTRGRAAGVSKILNSDENLHQRVVKKCHTKKETVTKSKRPRKGKTLESSDSSASGVENASEYDESDDSIGWNENKCVGCVEDYNVTTSKEDWFRCISCLRWLHENCSSYHNMCQQCGRPKPHMK